MNRVLSAISLILLIASADKIGERCEIEQGSRITCRCIGNEDFFLPEGYNYENVTSLRLLSCAFANLHFSSLTEASGMEEIIVQNISERLTFELFVTSKRMKRLELSGIRRVPLITHDTFVNLRSIDVFRIENTLIENFEEQFTDIAIANFSFVDVTIERIDGLNFSDKGGTLLLIDKSELRNVTGTLNFGYFSNVEILDSKIEFSNPGHSSVEGDRVSVENSIFSNASINLLAAGRIRVNATCADGKSSLRLSSGRIESSDNRLPTEIVYTGNKGDSRYILSRNNTVCIAGNCKCPKRNGQVAHRRPLFLIVVLQLFYLASLERT